MVHTGKKIKRKEPWWLFDPATLDPAAQLAVITGGERRDVAGPDVLSFRVTPPDAISPEADDVDK